MSAVNQIATMRMPDGREVAFVDWTDKPLFSTADLLTGFTDETVELFTYVSGDQVTATSNVTARRTSNDRDTNLATPGAMASTEELLVYAIKPEVYEYEADDGDMNVLAPLTAGQPQTSGQNLSTMHSRLLISLNVSQKIMHRAGFGYYNTGFGVFNSTANRVTQGFPSQEAVRSLVLPVHIGGQEKYRVTIENPDGTAVNIGNTSATPPVANADVVQQVRINLDGLYKRPVA